MTEAGEPRRSGWFLAVELSAVAATLACVWLTAEADVLCWPVGIVGCVLYLYVFHRARLYSDVLLQVYFLATSFYGWHQWLHGGDEHTALAVSRLSLTAAALWTAVIAAGAAGLGWWMKHRTKAALPYWDATTTAMSVVAQYLLTGKVVESWVLWIVADSIDTVLYFRRRLDATAALYAVLLALAVKGLVDWAGMLR